MMELRLVQNAAIITVFSCTKLGFTSNFTVIYDSQDEIINYSESLVTKSNDNKFVITSYSDGEFIQEEKTDLDKNFKFKLATCAFVNFAVIENTFLYAVVSNFISLLNASLAVRYPNILRGRLFIHCWIFLIV